MLASIKMVKIKCLDSKPPGGNPSYMISSCSHGVEIRIKCIEEDIGALFQKGCTKIILLVIVFIIDVLVF